MKVELIHGDCLEVMPKLPKNSVQMVFADLPYGVTDNHWDIRIDLKRLWDSISRVIVPNGAALFSSIQPFGSLLVASNFNGFRYDLIGKRGDLAAFCMLKLSRCASMSKYSYSGRVDWSTIRS